MTTTAPVAVGQHVVIDDDRYRGQVFRVDKVKVTKALLKPTNAAARNRWPNGVNVPMTGLKQFTGEDPTAIHVASYEDSLAELELKMQFEQGVIVRLKQAGHGYTTSDLFVVTANNDKTVSIVKLGGNGGRYLRYGHKGLDIVPGAVVTKMVEHELFLV